MAKCRSLVFGLFALVMAAVSLGLACCKPMGSASGKPVVMCTIFAYYDAARAIAKDAPIDVVLPLEPRVSPHEYSATPADREKAAGTVLYIKNGLMLDDRFDKLVEGSNAKTLIIADHISKDLLLHTTETSLDTGTAAKPSDKEDTSQGNPHIWLDPMIQEQAAGLIRDALIEISPANKTLFEKNAAAYIAELNKLNDDFKTAAATFKTKDFIGFHSAYDYLAHRYGLRQIASVEEIPGEGLNPAQIEKITKLIEDNHIHYVAVETGLSDRGLGTIVSKTHVETITLQPLETYDRLDDSYVSLMRQNLESLTKALGGS